MLSWFGAQLLRCSMSALPPFCTYTTSRFAARYSGRVVCVGDDGGLGFGVVYYDDDIWRIIPILRCVYSSSIGVLENMSSALSAWSWSWSR